MSEKFINIDRDTPMFLPPDMRDWLPEAHLSHFVLEVVELMDLSSFQINWRGTGSAQYPPSMLLALLVYCYATGRFSSRVIEQASHYDVAVRYICANTHPDHDTICTFRRRNREAFEKFFTHVLEVAVESKVMKKVGTISVDGTKIHANASKHSAMSYKRANEMLSQLENEVAQLMNKAEEADASGQVEGTVDLSAEIARRQDRKAQIEKAVAVIESRNEEKLKEKKREYEAKVAHRQQRRERGEKVGAREPKEPSEEVDPKAQYNFTDPESRIMKAGNGKHFDQSYNAQACVEVESMLIVGNYTSDQANDKEQLLPCIESAKANGFEVNTVLADSGYYSEQAVESAKEEGAQAYIAVDKQHHGYTLDELFGQQDQTQLPENASAKEKMAHKLKSPEGAELYGLRKQTVEPVFGIIKQCMRFRQFLMRGKDKVSNEWNLVCTAYNMKRTFNLINASKAAAFADSRPCAA